MLLSFRMTNGNKSFRGYFETLAEESTRHDALTYLSSGSWHMQIDLLR